MKRDVTQESEDRCSPPPIPHHQLLRRIGRGSYGEVWIALDAMGKWCAVKIVWRDDADSGRAYQQEFRGLKRYDDLVGNEAHLMPIRNVGRDPGGAFFYYAMELADDASTRQPLPRPRSQEALAPETMAMVRRYRPWTLTEQLRQQGRLPQAECLEYGIALSSALEVIHCGRLVHRDVKPSNIIFVNGRPKLADVGLVTAIDATMLSQVGTSGFVPLYGAGTESGDLFALGKVIYLMATGKAIYEFPAEAADLGQLGEEDRRALAELRAVYDRACDVMPDDRYESAKALRDDLDLLRRNESVIHLRELQDSEGRLLQQARKQKRRLRLLALATIASVLLSIVAWWLAGLNTRVARQAVLAELDVRQLLRMRDRKEGWAQEDWNRVLRAASLGLDDEDVWRHAVATLSGLEAHQVGYWKNVEATSAAFAEDGRIALAGHGQNTGAVINGLTNRSTLPVRGEGKVAWTRTGTAWLLQAEAHACVVRDAFSGGVIQSLPLRPGEAARILGGPVLALSPDGTLASASLTAEGRSGRTVLWRVEDGEVLGERVGAASALAFSPDGTLWATGHDRGTVQIFSTSPLTLEATLGPGSPPNPITTLAFGRNARLPREGTPTPQPWVLAAADSGVRITVWDLTSRVPLAFCLGSTWSIQSLAFHPDGQILASAGRNGVTLWDATSGMAQLHLYRACGGDTRALAFDRSGSILVGGSTAQSQFAEVSVWKLEPNRGIRRFRGLTANVRKVAFSPDASSIAALSDEWVVGVWDCGLERLRALIEVPPGILADNAAIAFGPDGDRLAFAANRSARLYHLATGRVLEDWSLPPGTGDQLRFESDGSLTLIRLEKSSTLNRWRAYELPAAAEPRLRFDHRDSDYTMDSIYVPSAGSRFFGLGRDTNTLRNLVLSFDVSTGEELWRQPLPFTNTWLRLIVDAKGQWLTLEAPILDGRNPVWGGSDGEVDLELTDQWLAIGSLSQVHASLASNHKLVFIQNRDGSGALPISMDGMWSKDTLTFSADEKLFATGNNDGSVLVADIEEVRTRLRKLPRDARPWFSRTSL